MKRKLAAAGILLLLLFLLCYPQEALRASREGMTLWLNTLLPTLLPFLILTGFLIHTDGIEKIFSPFRIFWNKGMGLSCSGAYAFALGMLCGYPMGAKIASDLYQYGKISKREAEYLLTFSNNASPAFLTTYLVHICLEERTPIAKILGILIASDILCMLFFRFVVYRNHTCKESHEIPQKKETSITSSIGTVLDASIMNGFETITRLGGYILLFSLLSACISHYWKAAPLSRYLLLGVLEITTGLHQLAASGLAYPVRQLLSIPMAAFGGICIMAQTRSILDRRLSLMPYIAAKCLNAALTAIAVFVLLY